MKKNPNSPSSSTTKAATPEITPELLAALQQHLISTHQTLPEPLSPQTTINFGSYKLNPFPPNSTNSFKARVPVDPKGQVLLDYAWNARNKAQLTVTLQALAIHLYEANRRPAQRPLIIQEADRLEPGPPTSKLVSVIKELEYETTYLKREIEENKKEKEENKKMKAYIGEIEKREHEEWGKWKQFPVQLSYVKEEILDMVLSDQIEDQVHLQYFFRKAAAGRQLFKGITFQAETYEDEATGFKGCSYLTCSINLDQWKDINFEGTKLDLDHLLKQGVVKKLIITKKEQIRKINKEKVNLVLASFFEASPKGKYEVHFHTIPPSYYPKHLDNARSFVIIRPIRQVIQPYILISPEILIPEDKIDLLDQINMYRSLVYKKPFFIPPGFELIAEDRDHKIFTFSQHSMTSVVHSFTSLTTAFPEEALYFNRIKAYNFTRLDGDLSLGPYDPEETLSSAEDDDMQEEPENPIDDPDGNLQQD